MEIEENQDIRNKTRERIDFVKRLLEMNGFREYGGFGLSMYKYKKEKFTIWITLEYVTWSINNNKTCINIILHSEPLKPLREFIKLSNK